MKGKEKNSVSRRRFIGTLGTAAAGFTILPSTVIGGLGHIAPSDKLNIAGVGVGGVGSTNINNCSSQKYCGIMRCGLGLFFRYFLGNTQMPKNIKISE